jgi:DNA-binding CsgD family transcriptional regulator
MGFVSNATLQQALATLTDNEQAAIRLIVCRGLSYEQAARSLGVNITTINNWKHRGVRKLKHIIEGARPARASHSASSVHADSRRPAGGITGGQDPDPSQDHRSGLPTGGTNQVEVDANRIERRFARRVG